MTIPKEMPLACPHCGCEAGRYDFGSINVGGRFHGHSQWPCGFNYELLTEALFDEIEQKEVIVDQKEIVYHQCQRISK